MARIGETKCWNPACSCTDAAVNETAGGQVYISCHKCTVSINGKRGSKAFRDIMAVTRLDEPEGGAPAPAPPGAPAPEATPAPRRSGLFFQ